MATALQSMGVQRDDYNDGDMIGYGPTNQSDSEGAYPASVQGMANDILPLSVRNPRRCHGADRRGCSTPRRSSGRLYVARA